MKIITPADLRALSAEAFTAARRRMNRNLHPALTDPVQRMLNAFEPGTCVRPHRHTDPGKWELFVALSGRAVVLIFDAGGCVQERHEVAPAGPVRVVEIPAGTWHTLAALETGTVLLEIKAGPYVPAAPQDFAAWAPAEGSDAAIAFERWCHGARVGDRAAR